MTFDALVRQVESNLSLIRGTGYAARVASAVELIATAFQQGRTVLVFGNGGSSADAQHICGELVGRFKHERKALPAIALSANQAVLTAWSNDYSFEDVFVRQLEAFGRPGDVAWGISTSGNSPNVVNALQRARQLGLHTLGLTGEGGGRMAEHCDVLLAVPLTDTPRIQEIHLVTYHAICAEVEERFIGS